MAKFLFNEWLLNWLSVEFFFVFEWDKGNKFKNKEKHRVETIEVEEIFQEREIIPLGIQVSPKVREKRFGIIGKTNNGRVLQIVFTIRNNCIRPISARPAHKKERIQYEKNVRSKT